MSLLKIRVFQFSILSMALCLVVALSGCIIIVDGNPYDWFGIPPIISDPSGDAPYDVADIKEVYMTHDVINLYFRIDVYGVISAAAGAYNIFLDADLNEATGYSIADIGADYFIDGFAGKPFLRKWISPPFHWDTITVDLPVAWSGSVLETSVPLSAMGSPTAINLVVGSLPIDVYPEDTYVTYTIGTNVASIIMDGDPADWGVIAPIGTDLTGDAPDVSMDITNCYVANDPSGYVYIRMDISGTMDPLLDCIGFLDTDRNPNTGELYPWGVGVDEAARAYDVGGTILEAKSVTSHPDGTVINLFFYAWVIDYYDHAPNWGHAAYVLT